VHSCHGGLLLVRPTLFRDQILPHHTVSADNLPMLLENDASLVLNLLFVFLCGRYFFLIQFA
jgi:hypothetical protein